MKLFKDYAENFLSCNFLRSVHFFEIKIMIFKTKFAFLSVSKTFQNQGFDFTNFTFLGQLFDLDNTFWISGGTLLISGKLFKAVTHFSKITIFCSWHFWISGTSLLNLGWTFSWYRRHFSRSRPSLFKFFATTFSTTLFKPTPPPLLPKIKVQGTSAQEKSSTPHLKKP